jgi:ABC-type transport system involved in multi-copper enzyme maturation permease subunit
MTTTTYLTAVPTSSDAAARTAREFRAAVRSEWIKIRTVRATAIFVGLAVIVGAGMALILGKALKTDPYDHLPFTIGNTFLVSTWITTLFAVVAGTLIFTSEVHHGTLASVLAARPSKPLIVAAKAVVTAALGFVMGALGIVAGLAAGFASGMDTGDMSGAVSGTAWALVLTTFAAVLGLGVGLIIRHSAAAVTTVLVWALVVETTVRGMVPATASRLLPFTAAHGLLGTRSAADSPETLAAALSNVGNAAVIGIWAAAAVVIGATLLARHDS